MATKHSSPLMIQLMSMYVYSTIAPLLLLAMKSRSVPMEWSTAGIVWTAIACVLTTAAQTAFLYAIQRVQVHLVMGFTAFYPVLTFALCWAFLGEDVTVRKLIGIVTIVIGAILIGL